MLLELAVGDAYGAGFEFAHPEMIAERNDLSGYVKHPWHAIRPGCYTDDTQMSVAIAEAVVSGEPWTREMLAAKFVAVFRRDPRKGYSERVFNLLDRVSDGTQFLAEIDSASDRSGAAMRAGPLGVFPDVEEVTARTALQAAITHDTPDGIHAATAAALMTHYFLYDLGAKAAVGTFLEAHVPGRWTEPWQGPVGVQGLASVRAAVTAMTANDSMSGLLRSCIAFGGDVDTVAAIALAAGSCCREIAQDVPPNLVLGLENGAYGRDYLIDLDKQLLALVGGQGD